MTYAIHTTHERDAMQATATDARAAHLQGNDNLDQRPQAARLAFACPDLWRAFVLACECEAITETRLSIEQAEREPSLYCV
jgi:hypothetical protein